MTRAERPRVVICDESPAYAADLQRLIEHDGALEVVAVARSGEEAMAVVARAAPDLVVLEVALQGLSGLEAVERIMGVAPVPILVLSDRVETAAQAAAALAAGALDSMPKAALDLLDPGGAEAGAFRRRLTLLSGTRVIRHPRGRHPHATAGASADARPARAIGICSSMGGPHALLELLGALPSSFPLPVLIAQHITTGFADGLAHWLDAAVPLPVRIGREGDVAAHGVWVAPDDAHMVLERGARIALRQAAPSDRNVPSGDVLLSSLAATLGRDAVAVVLTGMGRDGAEGTAAVRAAGGVTIAQDEASSVIYGMPRAAAAAGADHVLSLRGIAAELCALRVRAAA